MRIDNRTVAALCGIGACTLLLLWDPDVASAAVGGGNLPWETPLNKLKNSFTGPVAMGLSLLGVMGAGAALIFGGDITGFIKSMAHVVLVAAVMVGAGSLMSNLGIQGATIASQSCVVSQGCSLRADRHDDTGASGSRPQCRAT